MLLGFKTELKPNNKQVTAFRKHCGVARHAWNQGLQLTKTVLDWNQANPSAKIKFPSAIDLHKWLVASVKPEFPWYYECSKAAPQYALRALRDAWDRCFKKTAKPPKFKKKGKHDSFTLDGAVKVVDSRHIQLPRIGVVKTFERLPTGVTPKSVTVSCQAGRWFISFKLEVEPEPTEKTNLAVGVDLGVKQFATLSNGETWDSSKEYKILKQHIARLQYLNRNKQKGSKNWRKAMDRIARLHYRMACIRRDFLHKLTTYLAKNFQTICIEDLNVSGMLQFGKLAGAVALLGFHEFRRQLNYKTLLYGSDLIVADRWFPSSKTCSSCGYKKEILSLSERVFHCEHCNFELDRDLNASLNLASLAGSLPVAACGLVGADSPG